MALGIAGLVRAQEPGNVPETKAPAPTRVAPPSNAAPGLTPSGHPQNAYWTAHDRQLLTDFGWLARFKEDDVKLGPLAPGENRVVFMGDSITDGWGRGNNGSQFFPGKPYINRGISGQTTSQMLVRFHQDVVALHPKAVVILAGTNDIAGNTGPIRNEDIEANYASLADLARANQIAVVFSSILPVHNYTERSKEPFAQRPPARILALNAWLKDYCATNGIVYLDYFSAMIDEKGLLKLDLAEDGLHPNVVGYKLMVPMAEAAIAKALANPKP